jgi:bacillithiol biosynthesis cysteine-adding enzyme BshC
LKAIKDNTGLIKNNKIFQDYTNDVQNVKEFYPLHYKDNISWQTIIDKVRARNADYSELGNILERQNTDFGINQKILDNIEKLASGSAFAVVTGQQTGIFTGPLYTIYKAMTAIRLSQYLSEKYQADFIPVFWVESNDHDLKEANHIYLLDSNSDQRKIEYNPSQYIIDSSVKDVIVDDSFTMAIDDFEKSLPNTEFKSDIFGIIRDSYLPSKSISYGFGRMMSKLFGKYGLVLIDPSDSEIKKLMLPIFQKEAEHPLKSVEILNSAGEKLRLSGYECPIEKSDDSTCIFIEIDGARRKLYYRNERFEFDSCDMVLSKSELLETLQIAPWRFSPNVALRPVIQDYILPTVSYIAGPGETAYFAQLSEVYQHFGVNMPIIHPRASFTIIEGRIQRVIEKNKLEIADLMEDHARLFSRLSREQAPVEIEVLIESSRLCLEKVFKSLSSELSNIDPNLANIVESARKKVDLQVNILKDKAYQSQRGRDEVTRSQIKRACMNVFPEGEPQERVFNIVQYLVLYSTQLLDEIMSAIIIDDIGHTFLYL